MANDSFNRLASLLGTRHGTTLWPKGDGRVEIPHGVVRLMGWRDKSTVWIGREGDILVLSGRKPDNAVGRVVVSMERARIPMSILRTSGMDGPVVASPDVVDGRVVVSRTLRGHAHNRLVDALRMAGGTACRLLSAAFGLDLEWTDEVPTEPPDDVPEAKLFLLDASRPSVFRVIGMPFSFQAHWVPSGHGSVGRLVPHAGTCQMCSQRAPERMSLIPAVRKMDGIVLPGFLLAQEELRAAVARQLAGRNPIEFDLAVYFAPFQDGMCSVYKMPPGPIPEGALANAQAACADPDRFLEETFGSGPVSGTPARAPMFIVEGNFAEEAKPRNLAKKA